MSLDLDQDLEMNVMKDLEMNVMKDLEMNIVNNWNGSADPLVVLSQVVRENYLFIHCLLRFPYYFKSRNKSVDNFFMLDEPKFASFH